MIRLALKSVLRPSVSRYTSAPISQCYSTKFDFSFTPGPPKLSKEDQDEFEELQRIANSQAAIEEYNAALSDEPSINAPHLKANDIGGFSPEFFQTIPEFEGDVNPKTGERGGPKQDPLRHGDYSFNGRVTDF